MRSLFSRRRAAEATPEQIAASGAAAGAWGVDPVDGDVGWTPLGSFTREVPSFTLEKSRANSVAAYRMSPLGRAIVDTYVSFCVGDVGVSYIATNPDVAEIVREFWEDPANDMASVQEMLLRDLMIMGEQVLELFTGQVSGVVRFKPVIVGSIAKVSLLNQNPMTPNQIFFQDTGQSTKLPLTVIRVNDETGLREGNAVYWRPWRTLTSDVHSVPFLSPVLDWIDNYDTVLSNLIDRTTLARYLVWDVKVTGGQEAIDTFVQARGGTGIPRSGTMEVHSDTVEIEPKTVTTGAQEDSVANASVMTLIAGGTGLAKTWLAEPEGTNRATSQSMAEPVRRRVQGVQKMWLGFMRELLRYVVDQAVLAGRLPAMVTSMDPKTGEERKVPASQSVDVVGPEIAAADTQITAQVLLNLSTGLQNLVNTGALSREAAHVAAKKAWEDYVGTTYTQDLDDPTNGANAQQPAAPGTPVQQPAGANGMVVPGDNTGGGHPAAEAATHPPPYEWRHGWHPLNPVIAAKYHKKWSGHPRGHGITTAHEGNGVHNVEQHNEKIGKVSLVRKGVGNANHSRYAAHTPEGEVTVHNSYDQAIDHLSTKHEENNASLLDWEKELLGYDQPTASKPAKKPPTKAELKGASKAPQKVKPKAKPKAMPKVKPETKTAEPYGPNVQVNLVSPNNYAVHVNGDMVGNVGELEPGKHLAGHVSSGQVTEHATHEEAVKSLVAAQSKPQKVQPQYPEGIGVTKVQGSGIHKVSANGKNIGYVAEQAGGHQHVGVYSNGYETADPVYFPTQEEAVNFVASKHAEFLATSVESQTLPSGVTLKAKDRAKFGSVDDVFAGDTKIGVISKTNADEYVAASPGGISIKKFDNKNDAAKFLSDLHQPPAQPTLTPISSDKKIESVKIGDTGIGLIHNTGPGQFEAATPFGESKVFSNKKDALQFLVKDHQATSKPKPKKAAAPASSTPGQMYSPAPGMPTESSTGAPLVTGHNIFSIVPGSSQYIGHGTKQSHAIKVYTGNGYVKINGDLRAGKPPSQVVKDLDSAFEMAPPTTQEIMVTRGVYGGENIFGPVGSKIGKTFTDRGYTSTSTSSPFSGDTRIRVEIPAGARVIRPNGHGSFGDGEGEVLLNRDSRFEVVADAIAANGNRHITLRLKVD